MSLLDKLNSRGEGKLPGFIGIELLAAEEGYINTRLKLRSVHLAPNGYLHAATIVALADTACGYGAFANLPEGASGHTTIELKSNFLGTKRTGTIECEARMVHGGRTTQVWDATVTGTDSGKVLALFRCTQMILYPH